MFRSSLSQIQYIELILFGASSHQETSTTPLREMSTTQRSNSTHRPHENAAWHIVTSNLIRRRPNFLPLFETKEIFFTMNSVRNFRESLPFIATYRCRMQVLYPSLPRPMKSEQILCQCPCRLITCQIPLDIFTA